MACDCRRRPWRGEEKGRKVCECLIHCCGCVLQSSGSAAVGGEDAEGLQGRAAERADRVRRVCVCTPCNTCTCTCDKCWLIHMLLL